MYYTALSFSRDKTRCFEDSLEPKTATSQLGCCATNRAETNVLPLLALQGLGKGDGCENAATVRHDEVGVAASQRRKMLFRCWSPQEGLLSLLQLRSRHIVAHFRSCLDFQGLAAPAAEEHFLPLNSIGGAVVGSALHQTIPRNVRAVPSENKESRGKDQTIPSPPPEADPYPLLSFVPTVCLALTSHGMSPLYNTSCFPDKGSYP